MKTISVCMIVKDEEDVIERAINSVLSFADEIIIVDTGSEDNTKSIIKRYDVHLYEIKWDDDFAHARNYGISKASKDYFMWLDADDVIDEINQNKILQLKNEIIDEDIFLFNYEQPGGMSFYRERLIKNDNTHLFKGEVHEVIELIGKLSFQNIIIQHKPKAKKKTDRNLLIYQKISKTRLLSAREEYYYARELIDNHHDSRAEEVLENYLLRQDKWNENAQDACLLLYRLLANKDIKKARGYLFNGLQFGKPHLELLLEIAIWFYNAHDYESATYYFKQCLTLHPSLFSFSNIKYVHYASYLYLALISYQKGDYKNAVTFNDLALNINKQDSLAIKNHTFYHTAYQQST